jgi:hypothetical protein
MRPVPDSCSIVLVGSWNTRLLNITWISKFLFDGEEVVGEFSAIPGLPDRFSREDIRILPGEDRLIIAPVHFKNQLFERAEEKAVRILKMLQYTPLRAVGVNYVFIENEPVPAIDEIFVSAGKDTLTQHLGGPLKTIIQRSFVYNDGTVNVSLAKENTETHISVNYHWQITDPAEAVKVLEGNTITMRGHALQTISEAYALSLEEEE